MIIGKADASARIQLAESEKAMKSIRETFEMLKPFYANPVEEPKAYSMETPDAKDCYREMQGCLRALLAVKLITSDEYRNAERYLRDIHFNKQWYS